MFDGLTFTDEGGLSVAPSSMVDGLRDAVPQGVPSFCGLVGGADPGVVVVVLLDLSHDARLRFVQEAWK